MTQTIHAIYENGVFRPLEALTLPEHERVTLQVETTPNGETPVAIAGADPLTGVRVATGIPDLAENFDDYRFGKRP